MPSLLESAQHPDADATAFRLCVAILSYPLPEDISQPAAVVGFVQRLCDDGARLPSISKLEALLDLISGLGLQVLELVPLCQRLKLQHSARGILKTVPGFQNQLAALLLLAKLSACSACLDTAPDGDHVAVGSGDNSSALFDESHQFFDSRMAAKTLDVAVVGSIQACSSTGTLTSRQLRRVFELAIEVCCSVRSPERVRWIEHNTSKIQKLSDKVSKLAQDLCCVRFIATRFVASLTGSQSIPPGFSASVLSCLRSSCPAREFEKGADLPDSLFCLDFLGTFIGTILPCLESRLPPSYREVCRLEKYSVALRQLLASCRSNSSVTRLVLSVICSIDFEERVKLCLCDGPDFASQDQQHRDNTHGPCAGVVGARRRGLRVDMCLLVSQCSSLGMPLAERSRPLAISALDCLAKLHDEGLSCPRDGVPSSSPTVRSFPRGNTEAAAPPGTSSKDWRTNLLRDLDAITNEKYELVMRRVASVCKDLEYRCEIAEGPFRAERKITDRLRQDLESEEAANSSLHAQAADRESRISILEDKNQRLLDANRTHQDETYALKGHVESLKSQVDALRLAATHETKALQEKLKDSELHHLSIVTAKDEDIEEKSKALSTMQTRLEELDAAVTRSKSYNEDRDNHTKGLAQEKQALCEHIERTQHEVWRLKEHDAALQDGLNAAQARAQDLETDLVETRHATEDRVQALEKALFQSNAKYNEDVEAKDREIQQAQRVFEEGSAVLESNLSEEREARKSAHEANQQREAGLTSQLEKLKAERDSLLREALEGRRMRQRIAAAVNPDGLERFPGSVIPEKVSKPRSSSVLRALSLRSPRSSLTVPRNQALHDSAQAPEPRLSLGLLNGERCNRVTAGPIQTPHRIPRVGEAQKARITAEQPLEDEENMYLGTIEDSSGGEERIDSTKADDWDPLEEVTLDLQVGIESSSTA